MKSKPNSDIGMNEEDDSYLLRQYPAIADFLIWPELRSAFKTHETKAKALKTGSRRSSFAAIVAIVLSLCTTLVASSELLRPFFTSYPDMKNVFAVLALVLLLAALMLGKGVLFGRKRDRWLAHRITAERIRQFYFQFLLANAGGICTAGVIERDALLAGRDDELERVLRRVDAQNYRQLVRDDGTLDEARLLDIRDTDLGDESSPSIVQLKKFWGEMRFDWQAGYAIGQLDRQASPFPIFGSLADQRASLNALEFAATLGIVALQCAVVVMQFVLPAGAPGLQISILLTSLFAIIVVGLQAYEDGLNITEDHSRNRTYASYTAKLFRDFKEARDSGDGMAQFRVMREMEDLAYFEMQQFLHAQSTARFSL
ncbi:MAG: hypothetical protein QNJ44_17555 [Rhodobacter sp.]|nr:hypothetical protein [Rhodobacter sp.]